RRHYRQDLCHWRRGALHVVGQRAGRRARQAAHLSRRIGSGAGLRCRTACTARQDRRSAGGRVPAAADSCRDRTEPARHRAARTETSSFLKALPRPSQAFSRRMTMSSAARLQSATSYFAVVDPIRYEGPDTDNPLAFRWYDKDRIVLGKRVEDHLRPAVCYWHSFAWDGHDILVAGTFQRPWNQGPMTEEAAWVKMDAAFDFFTRLGTPFYCFHDVDAMPAASNIREYVQNLAKTVDRLEKKQAETGVKLLWGTANLFSHPRYMGGAATNPDPEVWAFAATQVRHMMDATKRLGGSNYVLWGGREGYDSLLNTNLKRELDNFGR